MEITGEIKKIIKDALKEDVGSGDITTEIFVDKKTPFTAVMLAKEAGTLCGAEIAAEVFRALNKKVKIRFRKKDGDRIKKGETLMEIRGDRSILTAERTALNLAQRLSGIATYASKFSALTARSRAKIYDTRKTTPGLRTLEKYAVKTGGCRNHRFGLYDAFLVKDNHLACSKSVTDFLKKTALAGKKHPGKKLEIEVQSLKQLGDFLPCSPDIIMLDNMGAPEMKKAVEIIRNYDKKIEIEVSGGVTEKNLKNLLKLDVDRISAGALTHSAKALDISLEICTAPH